MKRTQDGCIMYLLYRLNVVIILESYFAFYLILFGASLMIGLVVTTIVTQSVMIGIMSGFNEFWYH